MFGKILNNKLLSKSLFNTFQRQYIPVSNFQWSTKLRQRVYLDVEIQGQQSRKLVFELYNDQLPITAENFRRLCRSDFKNSQGQNLTYVNSLIHKVIPGFIVQGGQLTGDQGSESIYGKYFKDESFAISHDREGLLCLANEGRANTNSSQFYITLGACQWLDRKNVVFGELLDGWDTLNLIEQLGSTTGEVSKQIKIVSAGEVSEQDYSKYDKHHEVHVYGGEH